MVKVKAEIKRERRINTYADLAHGNRILLDRTKEKRDGYFYEAMASLIFSAFTLEAYLNHLGQLLLPYWDQIEQIPPSQKLSVITSHLKAPRDDGKRPYQTLNELFRFRNAIAHGKSRILKTTKVVEIDTDSIPFDQMKSKEDEYCTIQNADRALKDVEEIIKSLHKLAKLPDEIEVANPLTDFGTGSREIRILSEPHP
jgi:hypothetical protein